MYKLLIVDDEKAVREGLKLILDWEVYGICICAEAENGVEALDLIRKYEPQMIITDIRMPIMDGLQLLFKIQELNIDCKTVVLSGYDDFHLVRQAMRYGAMDYILKPSSKENIIKIIEEIIASIEDEWVSRLRNNENLELLKNNVLNRMIKNEISSRELREKLSFLDLNISQGAYCVAVIDPVQQNENDSVDEINEIHERVKKVTAIYKVIQDMIEKEEQEIVFNDLSGKVVIIFRDKSRTLSVCDIKVKMQHYLRIIHDGLHMDVVIGIGDIANTFRNISTSYEQGIHSLEYQFVFGINSVLLYSEMKRYFDKFTQNIRIDNHYLKQLVIENHVELVEKYIRQVFMPFNKKQAIADPYVFRNCAMEILILVYQCFDEKPMVDKNYILALKEKALKKVALQTSLESLQEFVIESVLSMIGAIQDSQKTRYSKLVFDAVQSIESTYSDSQLSLQYLADIYHVNSAYLGRIFKKETGSSFADYLNLVRIERAKELLNTTNLKGAELCEKVGFTSYNYFYIVFKKLTGKSPMDIRK